jgi:hypothetical protein
MDFETLEQHQANAIEEKIQELCQIYSEYGQDSDEFAKCNAELNILFVEYHVLLGTGEANPIGILNA